MAALRRAACAGPRRGSGRAAVREYYESVNVVKASEDKTFPGAIAAGLASPWGQAVPAGNLTNGAPTYFGSYREVFARDLYEAFTGPARGRRPAAPPGRPTRFLFERQQQTDGSMPRNSLLNGEAAPDTGGLQLDETSYPILMDWQSGLAGDASLYAEHVIPAADFLVAHGPSDGVERWEEQSGYSPSTIAAEIAGLTAAAAHRRRSTATRRGPRLYQATADDFARNIKGWTVTTNGPYISPASRATSSGFAKTGDPNAAITYNLGNGSITVDQRSMIDAGLPGAGAPRRAARQRPGRAGVADGRRRHDRAPDARAAPASTATARARPESEDGYGDCYQPECHELHARSARPWPPTDTGSGHLWPVLSRRARRIRRRRRRPRRRAERC